MTFTFARSYSIDKLREFDPAIDALLGDTYSIPDQLEDLEADRLRSNLELYIKGPVYDRFDNFGTLGQVLIADSLGVFWGDVSGIGTPLQTIGVYDEGSFIGTFSNFNFVDGTDPDDLVRAASNANPAIANITVSDRWTLTGSDIYRNSRVGINNLSPNFDLDVTGTVNITSTLNADGSVTFNSTLDVDGATTLNNTLDVDGATTLNNTLDVDGATTLNNTLDVDGIVTFNDTTQSTDKDTGSLTVDGGVGIQKNVNVGGTLGVDGVLSVDNNAFFDKRIEVGTSGTTIITTGVGSVGFGTAQPIRYVEFGKNVKFSDAIFDTNNNVGFRTEETYELPRNVLTSANADENGEIIRGRFYDAANLIRLNLDFIASEAVGFITSTDYLNPPFVVPTDINACKDDIKRILKSITYDITRGGNSQCVGAGLSYYDNGGSLIHITGTDGNGYSVRDATVVAITSAASVSRYVINNLTPPKSYQSGIGSIRLIQDLSIQDDPNYSSNTNENACANVVSSITVCSNIVKNIVNSGISAAPDIIEPNGRVVWAPAGADSKNIIYVSKYGNDDNNGRTEGASKLTVGSAAEAAQEGDTIIIRSGVYYENNPIGLRTDVSITGQDLRLVTIVPNNRNKDVFHVRRGCLIENLNFAGSSVDVKHSGAAAVAFPPTVQENIANTGFIAIGPADEGKSGRWRSPYIRNCTNFMSESIGMKIDGDHATASTIGADLKSMVCDSFTQYNENGIGVSLTNNAYAQLVSIFTINCDIGIYADSGGQCDLTNSNSSFGNFGLVAVGLGSTEFTATVLTETTDQTDTIVLNNVYDEVSNPRRPYDGQAAYFKIPINGTPITSPLRQLSRVEVTNGGSGYSAAAPPIITIEDTLGNTIPLGPEGIVAEVSPTINEEGQITEIDVINSGRNYLPTQDIIVVIDGPGGATATAVMEPIFYTVSEATEPTASGISTVTFNEFIPYIIDAGVDVTLQRISRILTSGHSFEYIGSGTDINISTPLKGAIPIKENEVVTRDGAQIPFTSTDQKGNFDIGEGIQIDQTTSTIRGRSFSKAIQAEVTPLILALR